MITLLHVIANITYTHAHLNDTILHIKRHTELYIFKYCSESTCLLNIPGPDCPISGGAAHYGGLVPKLRDGIDPSQVNNTRDLC